MRATAAGLLLLSLAPLACGPASSETATSDRQPVLWEAARGETTIWLFGTVHVPDERVLDLLPEVEQAWSSARTVFFELDLSPQGQAQTAHELSSRARGPEGYSLERTIGAELHARLARALHPEMRRQLDALDSMRPWMGVLTLLQSELLRAGLTGTALDPVLYARARSERKAVVALETPAEQARVFAQLTDLEAVTFLEHTLTTLEEQPEPGADLRRLIDLYVAGDVEKLEALLVEGFDLPDPELRAKLVARVLDDRNDRMAERLLQHVADRPDGPFFVAVGALHMPGDTGLCAQLRERGFDVQRVRGAAAVEMH